MTKVTLTKTRILAGTYEGVLAVEAGEDYTPELSAVHLERAVGELTLTEDPSHAQTWHVRLSVPSDVLTDGVQTFQIMDDKTGATLDSFTIITGVPLSDDLRAEVDLLRAELDMLKKAFRRHCIETT